MKKQYKIKNHILHLAIIIGSFAFLTVPAVQASTVGNSSDTAVVSKDNTNTTHVGKDTSAEAIASTIKNETTGVTKVVVNEVPNEDDSATNNQTAAVSNEKRIAVNLASRLLTVYQGKTKIRMYSVGVGAPSTPSPVGYYSIQEKEVNPTWINPEDKAHPVPSGPDNPLGYRWLGFNGTYGIHGTNSPSSVGHYVSHGCIRLHEQDVEDLYTHVSVGTPVVVYYDRIVIDSAPDHTISYYIYPDGYNRQSVTIADVKKALAGYGVDTFASNEEISDKILASDGEPTFIAKAYDLKLDGQKLSKRALGKNGNIYLPAQVIATDLNLDLKWDANENTLTTKLGSAKGFNKSDVLYLPADNLTSLFGLKGSLTSDLVYELTSIKTENSNTEQSNESGSSYLKKI